MKAYYINLAHRLDRRERVEREFARVGVVAERFNALRPEHAKGFVPRDFVGYGCYLSHEEIIAREIDEGTREPIMIFEDDVEFCQDFPKRMDLIQFFLDHIGDWDIFWLGGTWHHEPRWHARGHPFMPECNCTLGKDWEPTTFPNIVRTYGCWCSYAYILNMRSAPKVLAMMQSLQCVSKALDWMHILMEPWLNTFAFSPGCVKQHDDKSDIRGFQEFSAFKKLGPHWFAETL